MSLRVTAEDDQVLEVALDRPEARNAIDGDMIAALHEVCAGLEERPRILVLRGSEGVFAAGADIRQLLARDREGALRGVNSRLMDRVAKLPMPTVAVVDGPAVGGGAELAYACDLRVASTRAQFSNPEVGLGIIAGAGACSRLLELVGRSRGSAILLGGHRMSASEALDAGLLYSLSEPDDLEAAVATLLKRMRSAAPLALRLTKSVMAAPPGAHPAVDEIAQAVLFETDEKKRRMTAFLERS